MKAVRLLECAIVVCSSFGWLSACAKPSDVQRDVDVDAAPRDSATDTPLDSAIDEGVQDAFVQDGGLRDAATTDAGSDAGTVVCNNQVAGYAPPATGGPSGESTSACIARTGAQTNSGVPDDQDYVITSFGGPGDQQEVSCVGYPTADATWYYAANAQRFACGQKIRLVNPSRTRCVVVQVADIGPNVCVEERAREAVFDVSPLAVEALYDQSQAGWSEGKHLFAAPVTANTTLGVCDHINISSAIGVGFIGGPCTQDSQCGNGNRCLPAADGFPGGLCTRECTSTCPDQTGPFAYTACADVRPGQTTCVSRCDFSLFAGGCREGYVCDLRENLITSGQERWVCVPRNYCE